MSKKVATFDVDMVEYEKLSNNKIKEFAGLKIKKNRDKLSLFLVEGKKAIEDSIIAFELEKLICTENWINLHPQFKSYKDKILIDTENKKGIKQISTLTTPSDVIAVFKKSEPHIDSLNLCKNKIYLLLDDIQDPGNLGTIIRTCDWFGVYEIFASKNTADIYNPKVVQSTMGSLNRVNVIYTDLEELIIKNMDIPVYGTLLDGKPINHLHGIKEGMILMGNEGNGISDKLKNHITEAITIPPTSIQNHPDSLNVAIATAVVLSQIILS